MDQHLSLSEARTVTGKSESTLKRLLREIVTNPDHPDRPFILPSVEEIERRKAANEPYVWKIDRQLLLRRFPADEPMTPPNRGATGGPAGAAPEDIMLQVLRDQLESKDRQIQTLEVQLDRKDEQISNLNERMRESNVLMRELQQKLALPSPHSQASEPPVDAKSATASQPKTAPASGPKATPTPKTSPKATPKTPSKPTPQKRGLFGRLFHRSK
jgi:cell division septation protein DedD